jgi:hypothetical protein
MTRSVGVQMSKAIVLTETFERRTLWPGSRGWRQLVQMVRHLGVLDELMASTIPGKAPPNICQLADTGAMEHESWPGGTTAEGLLPVGTVTFLVSDAGEEAFATARDALSAAVSGRGGAGGAVRIALTTGDARRPADGNYVGVAQHRAVRLWEAAHAGQIRACPSVGPHDEPGTAGGRGRGRVASPFPGR